MLRKIYARQTVVREIPRSVAQEFSSIHHRQGFPKRVSNLFCYGLFSGEELVGAIVFSNPRTASVRKKYCHELLRLVFPQGVQVVGGASKLIKAFIQDRQPYNFFTYQDTSGQSTDVYTLSGMKLVDKGQPKKILVRDGITFDNAENNRRDWFSMEQVVRYGADNLLGVNLGEQFDSSGKRMSNVEIFTKLCGYHIEDRSADRLYEWRNPNVWYYTYTIMATDSDKYYHGRKAYRGGSRPSVHDCVNDGYYGSGGTKFKNWFTRHDGNIIKTVHNIYDNWGQAVSAETELIGNKYRTDPRCLNSRAGGLSVGATGGVQCEGVCPKHGVSTFRGNACMSCAVTPYVKKDTCRTHGLTYHEHGNCIRCSYMVKTCIKHGDNSAHDKKTLECVKCRAERIASEKKKHEKDVCRIHGEQFFNGNSCSVCLAVGRFYTDSCVIHGEGNHLRSTGRCVSCLNSDNIKFDTCEKHGSEVPFIKGICFLCGTKEKYRFFRYSDYRAKNTDGLMTYHCPICHNHLSMTVKKFNSILSTGEVACSNCRKSLRLWRSPVGEKAQEYIEMDLSIMSGHSAERVKFHCPYCRISCEQAFVTLYRRIRDKGYGCGNCRR